LGCMWLQLARAIGGDRWSRVCQNCKRWSEIGGGTHDGRSDKRYCCGTCKAAAHAKKKVRRADYTGPGGSLGISHRSPLTGPPLEQRRTSGGIKVLPSCELRGEAQAGDNCGVRRCKAECDPTNCFHKYCGICELQPESVGRKLDVMPNCAQWETAETGEFKTQIRHYVVIPGTRSYLVSVCANDSCRNSPVRRVRHYATMDYCFGSGEQRHYDGGELGAIPPLVRTPPLCRSRETSFSF